jgi:hypothetical protein
MEVTIGSTTYDVYADLATANAYLDAQITATAWRAADDDTKKRALVSATRFIDRQQWQGSKTDEYQPLQFPRTGLTYPDGSTVPSDTVPQEVIDACCELAAILVEGSDIQSVATTESLVQSLKAGSVAISYFRANSLTIGRLPQIIQELLGMWLRGATGAQGAISFGTGRCTAFEDEYKFNEGI